jgi:hypothetical protein
VSPKHPVVIRASDGSHNLIATNVNDRLGDTLYGVITVQ